jgi:exonuclease III
MPYHCLMHIITVNICATRAAAAEGSFRPLARRNADFVCLQATQAHVRPIGDRDVDLPWHLTVDCAL